jgi:hypothetical protein
MPCLGKFKITCITYDGTNEGLNRAFLFIDEGLEESELAGPADGWGVREVELFLYKATLETYLNLFLMAGIYGDKLASLSKNELVAMGIPGDSVDLVYTRLHNTLKGLAVKKRRKALDKARDLPGVEERGKRNSVLLDLTFQDNFHLVGFLPLSPLVTILGGTIFLEPPLEVLKFRMSF